MNKRQLVDRWLNPQFVQDAGTALSNVFETKRAQGADLRGIVIGLEGAIDLLPIMDLQEVSLKRVDFGLANFSCSFVGSVFEDVDFTEVTFDTCRMQAARFENCSFANSRIHAPCLNDVVFTDCNFSSAKIVGRGYQEYGGRRTFFSRCDFRETMWKNLQLRACKFLNSSFRDATFHKCVLAGVTFTEGAPLLENLEACTVQNIVGLP